MTSSRPILIVLGMALIGIFAIGCKSTKKASANFYDLSTRKANVETLTVEVRDFHGRPDVFADIRGRLSSNVAVLMDVEQTRDDHNLYLIVTESTPLGSISTRSDPPFQTRVPMEVLGLVRGRTYQVHANGVVAEFTMP